MKSPYPKIALQGIDGLIFIRAQEILYALADGNYTHVHLTDNRTSKVLRKLKEVEQLLSGENFLRIHRSHLINLEHVLRFQNDPDMVIMSNNNALEVSRSRKADFIEHFTRI